MKIQKLRFKNIHSLKNENEIDFTKSPLSDVGIFAIIGPTGSGKSTLLDIITLALYSRTPRIGLLTKKSVENYGSIITRDTDDCFAEVEYEVKDKQYRSRWSISRARTGNLRDYEMELAHIPSGEIIEAHKKSKIPDLNTEIIGLNYEQFVKSIVLSQGEFAKFLKAKPEERGELLEKITGMEIYRKIGIRAFERQKEEKQKLEKLQTQLDNIELLSKDELNEIVNLRKNNETEVKELDKTIGRKNELLLLKQKILEIENQKKDFEAKKNILNDRIKQFEPEIIKLKKHEKLLNIKSEIEQLKEAYSFRKNIEEKQQIAQSSQNKLNIQYKTTTEGLSNLKVKQNTFLEEERILQPILVEVRELDNKINTNNKILLEYQKNFNAKKSEFVEIEKYINTNEAKKKNLLNEKNELDLWLNKNTILNELSQDFLNIKDKIKILQSAEKNTNDYSQKINFNNQLKLKTWEQKQEFVSNKINDIKSEIDTINPKIQYQKHEIENLSSKKEKLGEQYRQIEKQIQFAENYKLLSDKNKKLEEEQADLSKNLISEQDKKNIAENELEIIEKKLLELGIKYERQQLESKYKDIRLKLKSGDECFLCGSKQHPFVKNYTSYVDITKKEIQQTEKQKKTVNQIIQDTANLITKNKTQYNFNEKLLSENKQKLQDVLLKHNEINLANKWTFKLENPGDISTKKEEIIKQGTEIKDQIKFLNDLKELENQENSLTLLQEKINNFLSVKNEFKVYTEKYKSYISLSQKYNLIVNTLKNLLEKYSTSTQKTEKLNNEISSIENTLRDKKEQLSKIKVSLTEQKEALENEKFTLENIQERRNELFADKIPEQVEKQQRKKLKDNNEQISKQENNLTKIKTELSGLEQKVDDISDEILQNNIKIKNFEQELIPQLQKQGYETAEQALENILLQDKAQQINDKQNSLNNEQISLNQSIKDKESELGEYLKKDDSEVNLEQIKHEISECKNERQTKDREIGIAKNRLSENEKRQKQNKQLQADYKAQDKEYIRWYALAEYIGDAQGKRFSQFAQEITLMELISLSNRHLQKLNKRYILNKTQHALKTDLSVIDTYIGNTERSVQTLSGGETFLLSLALALGLSDLASQNTKIESLFIDEGFGSLDQQTLDKALETLEELQVHTNRTIGIISHVRAIKERITTQIELKKISSGMSEIIINN